MGSISFSPLFLSASLPIPVPEIAYTPFVQTFEFLPLPLFAFFLVLIHTDDPFTTSFSSFSSISWEFVSFFLEYFRPVYITSSPTFLRPTTYPTQLLLSPYTRLIFLNTSHFNDFMAPHRFHHLFYALYPSLFHHTKKKNIFLPRCT